MIFLGLASNYRLSQVFRHLFAWGSRADYEALSFDLAARYNAPVASVALYHSGRSALSVAISATVAPGSKVIVPGLTCIAVIRAIKAAGCTPVFCDIDPETLAYQPAMLDKIADTCYSGGIIVQNTLGRAWDVSKIEQIAKTHHLAIIEDLAHSAGRSYPDGREVGTIGAATVLSFGKGKAIDTINGGAVIVRHPNVLGARTADKAFVLAQPTAKPPLADRLRDRWYPVFGALARAFWAVGLGPNLISALVRIHWIKRSGDTELDPQLRLTYWQARLARAQLARLGRPSPDQPALGPLREYALVRDRAACLQDLQRAGYCLSEIWYDVPVAPARCATEADFPDATCPNTVAIAASIVNLPTWYPPARLARAREIIAQYTIAKPNPQEENL